MPVTVGGPSVTGDFAEGEARALAAWALIRPLDYIQAGGRL
jgi:hypothetical protein